MYCRKCGHEIPDDSVFCINCGAPVEAHATPSPDSAPSTLAAQSSDISSSHARKKTPWRWLLVSFAVVALIVCGVVFLSSRGKNVSILKDKGKLQSVSASVLLIECYDMNGELYATGSGFVAFDSSTVVTNYHVIEDCPYSISALSENGEVFEVDEILGYHQEMDIAFLHIQDGTDLSPLTLSEKPAEKTDPVVAIGSPLGLMNTVSEGIVSGFAQIGNESVIQFTASISHGSSGGVLLNEKGEAIGVTFGSFSNGQNLNLAVPIDYVKEFYSRLTLEDRVSVQQLFFSVKHASPLSCLLTSPDVSSAFLDAPVTVYGYISSTFFYFYEKPSFFLAENENDLLLYDDTEWYINKQNAYKEHKDNNSSKPFLYLEMPEGLDKERSRAANLENVAVIVNDTVPLEQLLPGGMVVVSGRVSHIIGYGDIKSLVITADEIYVR